MRADPSRPETGGGVLRRLRRIVEDRRGAGAVEFAIVAPLLIMGYVGAFEVSVAMTVARKVNRASSTVSDLLTQTQSVNKATLDTMKDVTNNILAPFTAASYSLKITGITVAADGKATVAWSRDEKAGTPYTKGTTVTLPSDMDAKSTFIVRTEFSVPHTILLMMPGLKDTKLNTLMLGKTSYFRQRVGEKVDCSDCP
ncbi:TadE/TadG family type IV pilus assembly protein [Shinella pollutisoli]|uniref:TadE/TadG family type IV pilus assembly protein n=1 Tax=Shinella pollutisoli TaxID=2250594 RepID=A0ABV7D9Z6_9HYPH|nr:TadE/TadG family type IV pilus assembly protein [Shinella pollutisoli]